MLELAEALERILSAVTPLAPVTTPLADAPGRFAATILLATVPLPGFDHSAMDGYAVIASDTQHTKPLPVIAEQPAGLSRHLLLPPGAAIRIFTGAPVPAGADAVIMQEDVDVADCGLPNPDFPAASAPSHIVCREPVVPGENVRLAGGDLCVGQRILSAGQRLTPARLALLASQGLDSVEVHEKPRIAIVTTGNELQHPGQALQLGQIYNSNGPMLQALCGPLGQPAITVLHVPDSLEATEAVLRTLIADHDFIILSGGVSVGDHDFVKPALARLGISADFWRIKIRPGKPLLFAPTVQQNGRPCFLFGLPGNPVSSFVTFSLLVRPALLKAAGAGPEELPLPESPAIMAETFTNRGDRPHFVFGTLEKGRFHTSRLQQSHALFGLSQANAVVQIEPGEECPAGAARTVILIP